MKILSGVLVAVLGAVLLLSASIVYYSTGNRYAGDNVSFFDHSTLRVIVGQGEAQGGVLKVQQPGDAGFALISSAIARFAAATHTQLIWRVDGLDKNTELHFIWLTRDNPHQLSTVTLRHEGKRSGWLDLSDVDGWEGTIGGVGLRIAAPLPDAVGVRQLILKTATPSVTRLIAQIWEEWVMSMPWSGRSINFVDSGTATHLLAPLPTAVVWAGLSALLYAGWSIASRRRLRSWAWAVFFSVAWLAVDMRWQWHLWQRLNLTYDQFISGGERSTVLDANDAELRQIAEAVKAELPPSGVRLFVVTEGPWHEMTYNRGRLKYHLLPYNVVAYFPQPPYPAHLDDNDYLLILRPVDHLNYDLQQGELFWLDKRLKVEPLLSTERAVLFRVAESAS